MIPGEAELRAWMVLAQGGDTGAYRQLLAGCQLWLGRFLARRTAPGQIDDLVQETLVAVHNKRASYDPALPFLPWLAAIARYRWIDQLRRESRAGEVELADEFAVPSGEEELVAAFSVASLLERLRPEQARVILLVKIQGLSIAEAARLCSQSEALVKVNIHRGLKKLAALVESE